MADSHKFSMYLLDPITGNSTTDDSFVSTKSTAYAVQHGGFRAKDPNGDEWTAEVLARIRMRHTAAIPHSQKVGFRTSGIHLHHKSAPVVSHITVAPGTQLVFQEGASNEIHWVYDDFDGDEQTHWHVKIFDEYTYNSLAFSLNNSTPMFEQTGKDKATSLSISSALPVVTGTGKANTGFVDGGVYYCAVRVAKDHNKEPFWSEWAVQQITAYVDQPKPPLLSVYTNNDNASNTIVIQSSDNLLGDNNGSMAKNQGDWQRTSVDATSAQSVVRFSHTAISNTNALVDGQMITSIAVGTTGYISNVGGITLGASVGTTFTVSGKNRTNTSALGFPTTGTFWVIIGSEKLLVRNRMDGTSKKSDTFEIVARGYLSTTAASHAQWSTVTYGLQQDIYTGSSGEIVHTFDVKKYGKPIVHHGITRWYPDATTSNGSPTVATISKTLSIYQATDPNDKKSRNHFWVVDPGGTLQAGQQIQIVYNTWNKTTTTNGSWNANPRLSGVARTTTTTENLHLAPLLTFANSPAETVTIKSVETDKIVTTASRIVGTITGVNSGGPGHPITHIDIKMATDGTDAGGQNFNGVVAKNTYLTITSGGKSKTVKVKKDTSWAGTRVGFWFWGWDRVTLPIYDVVKCPEFYINGHTDGSYFSFPDGATITSQSVSNSNVKKITLQQNYGQGKFAGQVLTLNDTIIHTSSQSANPSAANSSGHYVTSPDSTQIPSWIEKQTAVFQFKVDTLASTPPISYRYAAYPATGASGFPSFNQVTITPPSLLCSFNNGAKTIIAAANSEAASLYVGMPISGSGIQTGTTVTSVSITPTSNSIGISLTTTAASVLNGTTISVPASGISSSTYANYEVVMNGVPLGTTVTSASASSGNIVLTLSANGTVPISSYNSSDVPTYFTTNQLTLLAPTLNVIPAGSTSIPITPMKVNHNYPIHCPVRIDYPALLGENGILVKPVNGNQNAEVSLIPSVNTAWTTTNNVPVQSGQTYGLAGHTRRVTGGGTPSFIPYIDWYNEVGDLISTSNGNHSVVTPYFYGNVTNGSNVITSLTGTSTAVKVGNGIRGVGIPAGATITSIGSTSLTMSVTANATNTNVRISNYTPLVIGAPVTFTGTIASATPTTITGLSTTTGLAIGQTIYGYGLPQGTTISTITASASSLTISQAATAFSSGNSFRTASTGVIIGEVGAPYYLSPMGQYGQNWTPNAIVGKAPDSHTVASACYFTSTGDGTTGYYTVTAGSTTISLSAGATITDGFGNTLTVIQSAPAGSTTINVGFDSLPSSSPTYLTVAATRAVPRFQWNNTTANDVYALASVMFRALTPYAPNTSYVPLATQLDTVQKPVSTTGYSPTSIILNKATKTNGSETMYLLDPALDYGSRETAHGSTNQILWTLTSSVVKKNATSIPVTNVSGLAPGSTLTIGYGTANQEDLLIATGWGGYNPVTIDHSTPIKHDHPQSDRVYAFTNALQSNVFQPQVAGTPVAVFNWNSDGWINTPQASYTLTVQRSENNGTSWTTLRNGENLTVDSHGVATIQDYEMTIGATQQYRAWATYISPSGHKWQGEVTYQLQAPLMTNNQWWISSTSNPALRYPLLVQNQYTETMKHPNGVLYPLGSRFPITIAGVVGGRDGSIDVIWNDIPNWQNFLNFLRLGEIYILQNPVEKTKSYIFIHDDVTWENNASSQPYRKVTIPYIEAAPPNFGYTYGN